MKLTTLCYLEQDEKYLMLHRIKKQNDVNKDKWIGIGGKFEFGESPEDCLLREAFEETGYTLTSYKLRGIVTFLFNDEEAEYMFLYTADGFTGEPQACGEGTLEWIPKTEIDSLNLWEGDRIFHRLINEDYPFFSLKLHYRGNYLEEAVLDGEPMELLDVLDESGESSGLVRERTLVHEHGDFHRTSHVWVVRKAGEGGYELLLQKRSSDKDSFAGCYDISSAGHIPAGVDYKDSARRELFEELGVSVSGDELVLIDFHEGYYEGEFHGKPFINREKSAVYLYFAPAEFSTDDLTLQESEVEEVRWFVIDEVLRAAHEKRPEFCLYEDEVAMVKEYLEQRDI